tara:strand:+ start:57 stop:647 length:591 start_codon:yes stop_codon:yes gene_type:complete
MKKTVFALTGISLLAATAAMAQPAERTSAPMTRAEVSQKSAERFQKMDLNGDGVLDLADRELRREQRIARIDTDGNGAISAAEREAAREARQERRAERREARGLDAERAGEGKRGKRGMRGRMGRRDGGMMARADANGDGRLTLQEFQAHALERFDRADADSNGTVTAEERKAAREAHRAEMRERSEQRRATRDSQ